MADDAQSNLNIAITTRADLAGVTDTAAGLDRVAAGAAGSADAVAGYGVKAAGAAEKTGELTRDLTSLRGGTRAARELFEVMEGGEHSIAGIAGLMRLLVITTEGLAPEVAVVASLGLALAATFAAHSKGAVEAKSETDKASKSVSDLGDAADATKDQTTTAIEAIIDSEKKLEDEGKRELQLLKDRQTATKELIEVNKQLAINVATQEFLAGNKPSMSDEELARRKRRFDAQIKDIEATSTVNVADADRDAAAEDLAAKERLYANTRQQLSENVQQEDNAASSGADAKNLLAANGIKAGAKDDKTGERPLLVEDGKGGQYDFGVWAQQQLDSGQQAVNEINTNLRKGAYLPQDIPRAQTDAADRQKQIDTLNNLLISLRLAARNLDVGDVTKAKLDPEIEQQQQRLTELHDQIQQASQELDIKSRAADAARGKAINDVTQQSQTDQRTTAKEQAERDFKDTQAQVEAEIKSTQNDLTSKTLQPWQREYAEKTIGVLQAYLKQLAADRAQKFHDPATAGEQAKTAADESGDFIAGNTKARDIADTAAGVTGKNKGPYDEAMKQQAALVDQIGQLANADGMTKLINAVHASLGLHTKTADIIAAGAASADTRITAAVSRLAGLQHQIDSLVAKANDTRNRQ